MQKINSQHKVFQNHSRSPASLLLPFILSALALAACSGGDSSRPASGQVFPLPALAATVPLDDRRVEFGERTLLINFWATWCTPCRDEMPDLQALSEHLDRDKFAVIGVSIDEDRNLVREFLLDHGIRFANFHDRDQSLASGRMGIRVLPVTFLVAPGGAILARIDGARAWNPESLRELLGKRNAADSTQTLGAPGSMNRT